MALTKIEIIHEQLREAILDPKGWTQALATISNFVGSAGLVLLSVDERLKDAPRTDSLSEMMEDYFARGWHARDARESCLPVLLRNRVVLDDDFQDADRIESSSYYADFLSKHKQKWFAGVGAFVDDDLWCLAFQRSRDDCRFQRSDLVNLHAVQSVFARSVGLASKSRKSWIAGALTALEGSGEPAFFLDRFMAVLHGNENARLLLRPFVNRRGQLELPDKRALSELRAFIQECRHWRLIKGVDKRSIEACLDGKMFVFEVLPLMQEDSFFFHRAVALVKIRARRVSFQEILRVDYKLTTAEIRVVDALGKGKSLNEMADLFCVSVNTIRFQIKSVYAKTGTGTQAKLLALMLRIQTANDQSRC